MTKLWRSVWKYHVVRPVFTARARFGRLRDETLAIGKMLEKTMMEKYGPAELQQHYMVMDTICDATQARSSKRILQQGCLASYAVYHVAEGAC